MIPADRRIDLLKVIAHPVRIKILENLVRAVKCVSDFGESLDISQPNVPAPETPQNPSARRFLLGRKT